MEWYLSVLKRYADFSGRARRKEYWMFTLFSYIAVVALAVPSMLTGSTVLSVLYCLYILATFVPSLAVTVRRLHDTNRSGWMFLIAFIPLVGAIVVLVFLCSEGTPGDNQYGPNPKLPPAPAAYA
jgi:uncharacterized membrane protein YhaH (DUF805 family)